MSVAFDYGVIKMKDMKATTTQEGKKIKVKSIIIKDEEITPTKRFWKSWQMRFKINDNVFKYFNPAEVFNRISEVQPNDKIRYSIERIERADGTKTKPRALGVSNPSNPYIKIDSLINLLEANQTDYDVKSGNPVLPSYSDGFIRSRHVPRNNEEFDISGDLFQNRYVIDTPIDGFGRPQIFISLLRLVCANGAVAYSPTFRSEVSIGKKNDSVEFALSRMLQSFNSEEGFSALRQRFEAAGNSWASVNEAMKLQRTIIKIYNTKGFKSEVGKLILGNSSENNQRNSMETTGIMKKFQELTGNMNSIYGVANIDSLSEKKQKTLPAGCKVYDLLNFTSELASHYSIPSAAKTLQAYIGGIVSSEYDLEDTCKHYSDYKDFFIGNSSTADTLASMA